MSTPSDDELRTIGLPRGSIQDMLKGAEAPKPAPKAPEAPRPTPKAPEASRPKATERPAFDPRGPEVDEPPFRRGPVKPLGRLEGEPVDRDPRSEDRELLATVLPPGAGRPARPAPPPPTSRPPEAPRPPAARASGPARPEPPPAAARLAPREPRREPMPPPSRGRSLDDSDLSTNAMPRGHVRPTARPLPEPPAEVGFDDGVPLDQTRGVAAPARPGPAPVPDVDEPGITRTPAQFARPANPEPYVRPVRPAAPTPRRDLPASEDEYEQTMAGALPSSLAAGTRSTLQFFNSEDGRWVDLGKVGREGKVLGRNTFQEWDANPQGLAEEHLEIGTDGAEMYVEPLETLNGVYRKLLPHHRQELTPGTRFRIGRHVLEFRLAGPPAEIPALRAPDGEVFQTRILVPLGFLDLIGPNGRPYLSFPVTKREERGTRIGRAGVECDFALAGDEWVSLRHARVFLADGKWWLEDLESTNGTYLIVTGRTPLRRGTTRAPGSGDELLVGGYKIRVIEEKA